MIRERRKVEQWQNVSKIELGPGQYSPYASNNGGKYSFGPQEKPYHVESPFPKKKTDIPFGSGQDRFKKFLPLNVMPGPGQYEQKKETADDLTNGAAVSFKSQSPRLQMYYELERSLSKSVLNFNKQEILANQLVQLIDRKMKERNPSLLSRSVMNGTLESGREVNKKVITGLAITSNIKHDRVPSIPFEPRREETAEVVGPATYDPNQDAIHKRLPALKIVKKEPSKPVPKKALESFINTIFQPTDGLGVDGHQPHLVKERSSTTLRTKHIKKGNGALSGALTQQTSPNRPSPERYQDNEENDTIDPFNKPTSIFLSKTKRTNLIDEKALGPGFYNPQEYQQIGVKKESEFKKKVDFGNMEGRKFTIHRSMLSPFNEPTYLENPESWKYQHPEKESAFMPKLNRRAESLSVPHQTFSSVAKVVERRDEIPGPGSYDVNFRDELRVLDQKLSIRYQLGPFGSTAPRFKEKPPAQPEAQQNDQKSQQVFNIIKKQEMRKYMDEALKLIKDMQSNQESSIFKSVTDRFNQAAGSKLGNQPSTQIGTLGGGPSMDDSRITEPSTMQSLTAGPSTSRLRQYQSMQKPFDSTSPRFNYKKIENQLQRQPGPGQYSPGFDEVEEMKQAEIKRTGTINKKYVPAIGNENRQRFSLFGQIVTKGGLSSQLGPGSYDINTLNTVASKKVFNASLMKQGQPTNTSSLSSTNVRASPRSTVGN